MKKVLVFILAALMLLSIVGCASTPPEPTDSGTQAPATDSGDAAKPQDGEQKSITYVTLGDTGMELLCRPQPTLRPKPASRSTSKAGPTPTLTPKS